MVGLPQTSTVSCVGSYSCLIKFASIKKDVFSSSEKFSASHFKKEIDLSDAAHGVYFIEIKTEKEFVREKIVVVK